MECEKSEANQIHWTEETDTNETREQHISNWLNLLYPRKDMAEMVIVFRVSPIVPEGLVLVDMKWASDWKEAVAEAEAAEQAAAEEKAAAAAMKKE